MSNETDVFVIGGGPAGLAAAIAARQQGLRVLVADGARPPIDKACGEVLMPDAITALATLGIFLPPADRSTLRGVRFVGSGVSAEASFPCDIAAVSIRRTVLHRIMAERAASLGIGLLWQSTVTGIRGKEVQLGNRTIRTSWMIGADGANSRVRRWADLDAYSHSKLRYAFRRHYRVAPWNDRMEIHWGKSCQGYATAVNSDQVCVAIAHPIRASAWNLLLRNFPNSARGCAELSPPPWKGARSRPIVASARLEKECRARRGCFRHRRRHHRRGPGSGFQSGFGAGELPQGQHAHRLPGCPPASGATSIPDGPVNADARWPPHRATTDSAGLPQAP